MLGMFGENSPQAAQGSTMTLTPETQKHRNTGGTAQSPSSHSSHHDKAVDEAPSGSKVHEEVITEQPTKTKTNTVNILKEALLELATVHGLLLGADQDKLCSPEIIKAAMTELTSVTCLLQGNLQKRHNQLDSSSSLKGGGGNNYTTHSSSNNTETMSPISYSHQDKVVDIDPRQEANSQEGSVLQILPSLPRQHSLPATIYKVCSENQSHQVIYDATMPNNSHLVRYMGKNYMLEGQYDDSHRISLTKDTFKPAMSYPYNAMPETSYPYKNHMQMGLLNRPYRASLSEDTSQLVLSYPYIPARTCPSTWRTRPSTSRRPTSAMMPSTPKTLVWSTRSSPPGRHNRSSRTSGL